MKFNALAALFLTTALVGAIASHLDRATRDVLLPTTGTVWTVGAQEMVTWDASDAPGNITNKIGRVLLRKAGMTLPVILADNFDILQGSVQITVPGVEDGNDYQVNRDIMFRPMEVGEVIVYSRGQRAELGSTDTTASTCRGRGQI
ncbi:hypothetical protein CVT26_003086 [Gymnopilus dilepis]|uniref:Uncharacterized protein n=1 Tax=Gymnopilus dilepis TaxID=231916 RepID=A0A409Y4R6_9AGAR|nr:hypothetical protein CVT26_003086 [Gymnopilus dilepis]